MFYTVCTKYIHVALAASVLILWKTFMFGHSCNYTVVLSKNVPTWNKTIWLFFITFIIIIIFSLEFIINWICLLNVRQSIFRLISYKILIISLEPRVPYKEMYNKMHLFFIYIILYYIMLYYIVLQCL